MIFRLNIPINVYTVDDEGLHENVDPASCPLEVKSLIAEVLWSAGQAIVRLNGQVNLMATLEVDDEDLNGRRKQ